MAKIETLIGREDERRELKRALEAPQAELVAVYGRRRVGKTFLIEQFVAPLVDRFVSVTGLQGAPMLRQLVTFEEALQRSLNDGRPVASLKSWHQAFKLLADLVEHELGRRPEASIAIFLDELPWLATRKAGLLPELEHIWNTRLSKHPTLTLIVCGSAASWMIEKVLRAKGGFHNRVTRSIRLAPFSLAETKLFLRHRRMRYSDYALLDLYMALGGVPHYLALLARELSVVQNIGRLCFGQAGMLRNEFEQVFASLFQHAEHHMALVRALGKRRAGLTRKELLDVAGVSTGGRLDRRLRELVEAGFVEVYAPYGTRVANKLYRLSDPFSWFHLSWMESAPGRAFAGDGIDFWAKQTQSRHYSAWAGFAFEDICLLHARQIARALKLEAIRYNVAPWRYVALGQGAAERRGAQVDLLFDREDGVVSICEMKFSPEPFKITRAYARSLEEKAEVFKTRTRTRKDVRLVLVTVSGLAKGLWSDVVDDVVTVKSFV